MEYDFSHKYTIRIKGKPDEIRDWIKEISNFMDKGTSYSMMPNVDNLEKIVDYENYTFNMDHRIYYKKNMLMYVPNVNSDEAKELRYRVFKQFFDEVRPKIDEKYQKKPKTYGKRDDLKKKGN